jgi:hypothetical protein
MEEKMSDTLVQTILDGDYGSLKEDLEKVVAKKLHNRILNEKTNVLAQFNKLPKAKMVEILATAAKK